MRRGSNSRVKGVPWRTQRGVLCAVMLGAAECGTWLTLSELGKLTHYPPASISAQLRHLRKPQYGGYALEKRRRVCEERGREEEQGAVWEYRLSRGFLNIGERPGDGLRPPRRGTAMQVAVNATFCDG